MIDLEKLERIKTRYDYLTALLSQLETLSNTELYTKSAQELSEIQEIVDKYEDYCSQKADLAFLDTCIEDEMDSRIKAGYKAESAEIKSKIEDLENTLKLLLTPKDPNDDRPVIIEIRAGVGGDESCLFVEDLFNMYMRYAAKNNYEIKIIKEAKGTVGTNELDFIITGKGAYSKFKFEAGTHRVQRIPETESKGRVHTSAATVAVLFEPTEIEVNINPADLRIEATHASSAGGQNVNKTSSAIRIVHIPTGIAVESQMERSQLQNKEMAMKMLKAKLYHYYNDSIAEARIQERQEMVGDGDRSGKIRTYNYPQNRITDHRIDYSSYNLDKFMLGNMDELVEKLQINARTKQLAD